MKISKVISELSNCKNIFREFFSGASGEEYLWKPSPDKWCMLEVLCHLYDEEREDFRARLKHVLENPELPLPPSDPQSWVKDRNYISQNYEKVLEDFLTERDNSIDWLNSLSHPKWENAYRHPTHGPLTARMFLINWLAHDYHHIRQLVRLRYDYLKETSKENLAYAGDW